jgi:SHS family lactate transporter-like MFS transporter
MFMVGLIPGVLLAIYIYMMVPESPVWRRPAVVSAGKHLLHLFGVAVVLSAMLAALIHWGREEGLVYIVAAVVPLVIVGGLLTPFVRQHWKLAVYAILLMTGFNFFSHGTQDLYPTFLRVQHHFDDATVTFITVVLNLGAIVGGLTFASFSQSFGRRKTVILVSLLALPVIYFWASGTTPVMLALGAFLMQICVQGAWGVVPVHLNELSPAGVRSTFAGTVYQLGNLIASVNAVFQAELAESGRQLLGLQHYSLALAVVACFAALLIATMMFLGPEAKDADMGRAAPASE